jgi:hypothetical protein
MSSPGKGWLFWMHIPPKEMESYVMRTLPDLEIEPLEVHLFMCQECRDRLVAVLSPAEKLPQT